MHVCLYVIEICTVIPFLFDSEVSITFKRSRWRTFLRISNKNKINRMPQVLARR